jgi:hypothetical protein
VRLEGVLAEPAGPAGPVTAVLLNAGAIRRIGPNRMWVEIARRWAAAGVPTLRVDLRGIGDSEGESELYDDVPQLYAPDFLDQVRSTFDALAASGHPDRFAVAGLCSGGYWAFQVALDDERVVQALPLNAPCFFFDQTTEGVQTLARIRRRLFHPTTWRRVLRGELSFDLKAALAALLRRRTGPPGDVPSALDRLRDRGTRVDLLLCDGELLLDELAALGPLDPWPDVAVERIPGRDHMLRPVWMHEHVHAAVDRALDRALGWRHASPDRAALPTPVGDGRGQRHA